MTSLLGPGAAPPCPKRRLLTMAVPESAPAPRAPNLSRKKIARIVPSISLSLSDGPLRQKLRYLRDIAEKITGLRRLPSPPRKPAPADRDRIFPENVTFFIGYFENRETG